MQESEFRKLDIDLPKQPVIDEGPWMIAGVCIALAVLLLAACTYILQ